MRCRARASVPAPAAAWHTLLRRGEASAEPARHWQLHETTSCRCAAAEPARRAAGKFPPLSRAPPSHSETSPGSAAVVPELLLVLPSSPALHSSPLRWHFPPGSVRGWALQVFSDLPFPGRSPCCGRLGRPCGLVPGPEPLGPSWRHLAQPPRSGSGGTGRCCCQRGGFGRDRCPFSPRHPVQPLCPPSPLTSSHRRGLGGLCSRKARAVLAVRCGV